MRGETDPALAADIELLFERIDNRWGQVERLLVGNAREARTLAAIRPRARTRTRSVQRVAREPCRSRADHLRGACEQLRRRCATPLAPLPGVGHAGRRSHHVVAWQQLAVLALTKEGTWRKQVTKTLGVAFEQAEAKQQLKSCIELAERRHRRARDR